MFFNEKSVLIGVNPCRKTWCLSTLVAIILVAAMLRRVNPCLKKFEGLGP